MIGPVTPGTPGRAVFDLEQIMTEKAKLERDIARLRKSINHAAAELLESLAPEEREALRQELSYLIVEVAELNGKL